MILIVNQGYFGQSIKNSSSAPLVRSTMRPTLARTITPAIRSLCRELVPDGELRFVTLRPLAGADPGDCFPVVLGQVEREGGVVCHGWRIWEMPSVFVEAEFHAVWRSPQGELLDVTPVPMNGDRILFVPDPTRVYEGRQMDNVRRALTDNAAIHDFFRACGDSFELMNRGARAEQHGKIALRGPDREEWLAIEERKAEALSEVLSDLPKPGRNDPCHCGSGKKFKKCHGA
jgi:hypothetical protein